MRILVAMLRTHSGSLTGVILDLGEELAVAGIRRCLSSVPVVRNLAE